MQEIGKFLVNNWRLILEVVILITSFIFAVVRKRGYVFDNSNHLYSRISELIVEAERQWPQGHGKEKLDYVVSHIVEEKCGGHRIPAYEQYISLIVEKLLSIPQKKGEK